MITIKDLRLELDSFSDSDLVEAYELDGDDPELCNVLGIFKSVWTPSDRLPVCGEPIGHINTLIGGVVIYEEGSMADIHPGTVPAPCGSLIPSLTGSYNYNTEHTPDWLIVYCPNCGSDNVCCLSLEDYPEGRWFCISCYDSWVYERE